MSNYRFYSFTNMYLSSMQKGIQTAHAVSEMYINNKNSKLHHFDVFNAWAYSDKTIVVLDGGNQQSLKGISSIIGNTCLNSYINEDTLHNFPNADFYEDKDSLNGALTCVGVIVSEAVYNNAKSIREGINIVENFPTYTHEFYKILAYSRLAN